MSLTMASKEELLDGMIHVVFQEIELPPEGDQSAMRRRAVSARQVLARLPVGDRPDGREHRRGPRTSATAEAVTAFR